MIVLYIRSCTELITFLTLFSVCYLVAPRNPRFSKSDTVFCAPSASQLCHSDWQMSQRIEEHTAVDCLCECNTFLISVSVRKLW